MTLDDLRISMQNFMPVWVDIEKDDDGQIVIYTNMVEDKNGNLVDMDELDDMDDDEDEDDDSDSE